VHGPASQVVAPLSSTVLDFAVCAVTAHACPSERRCPQHSSLLTNGTRRLARRFAS